jgi:hypothetical protein
MYTIWHVLHANSANLHLYLLTTTYAIFNWFRTTQYGHLLLAVTNVWHVAYLDIVYYTISCIKCQTVHVDLSTSCVDYSKTCNHVILSQCNTIRQTVSRMHPLVSVCLSDCLHIHPYTYTPTQPLTHSTYTAK